MARTVTRATAQGERARLPAASLSLALERWSGALTWLAASGAALVFAGFALQRHAHYESTAYDLGFFDQLIWNTAHGRWFESSFTDYSFLGQHFQPVLLAFAALYRAGAGPEALLAVQSAAVALAAVPLFEVVRRLTGDRVAGLLVALAYLFSARLHAALDFDLHPELFALPLAFTAFALLVAGRARLAGLALLPTLLLKEDMALLVAAVGLVFVLRGERRVGGALVAVGGAWLVLVVGVLMPAFRGGVESDLLARYGYLELGASASALVRAVPRALEQIAGPPALGVLALHAESAFLGLLSPAGMLAAAPVTFANALSEHRQQARLELHYVTLPLALTWVAAALGLERLARGGGRSRARTAASAALAASVVAFLLASPFSPRAARPQPTEAHRAVIAEALALVPEGVPVSAQGTLLPHVSQRVEVREFPDVRDSTQYAVIDPSLPVTQQALEAGYLERIEQMPARGFERVFDRDGVVVFRSLP